VQNPPRQVALRFQFTTLNATLVSHCERWRKLLDLRNEGVKDPRSAANAQRHKASMKALAKAAPGKDDTTPSKKKDSAKSTQKSDAKRKKEGVRTIYEEFLNAKLAHGEAPMEFEKFEANLKKKKAALLKKYGVKDVNFRVETKNGKVSLKARLVK